MRQFYPLVVALLLGVVACSSDKGSDDKAKAGKEEKKDGKDKGPPPPCHPGCFPAGTMVATPDGPRPIESVRRGDRVTVVGSDGAAVSSAVDSTFQTCNRLVEVRTDHGTLLTTLTQPFCLRGGGFRPAGDLAKGDVVWRWQDGERRPARIRAVVPTDREAPVHNLVVGESAVFVAGGYLVRGKPPLEPGAPTGGSTATGGN
jgi:hypothetical protein